MKTSRDPRHQSRRLAFAVVHALQNSKESEFSEKLDEISQTSRESLQIEKFDQPLFESIINGIQQDEAILKDKISTHSTEWPLEKMYNPDLVILLISTWEILCTQTPVKVAIDEAIELAKEFGEAESPKFINGVLAGVANEPRET